VELFLNGLSLGRKSVSVNSEYKVAYSVPYQPGQLKAVGYRDGQAAESWALRTAGSTAAAKIHSDRQSLRANSQDLAYVTVDLSDQNGTPIYAQTEDRQVKIVVEGAAELIGIGNGNPIDVSSFQSGQRRTFHGQAVAVIRAGSEAGDIKVRIAVDGLPEQRLRLHATSEVHF
jgi:beta-galactosidase